ncbi:hypothetical protein O6H91_02G059700 [Diphasiastrum complanatum]|uniref:Uncharacterized protein n=1 Tax=Diphasiastrum complanatum TaxID=34168 RepID=A0ACC2EGB7_DIPCM|nr:hypothetical protein O6H91_02G059700 [Diphasiastrum complanatum]
MFHQTHELRCRGSSEQEPRCNLISNWGYHREDHLPASTVSSYPPRLRNGNPCREEAAVTEWQAKRLEIEIETEATGGLLVEFLLRAARAVATGDWALATEALATLGGMISPRGDAAERVGTHFANALVSKMTRRLHSSTKGYCAQQIQQLQQKNSSHDPEDRFHAYLALNKLTPFIRFAHLTANQAILEAVEMAEEIHIVDLDIMQGVQWPPLMQALTVRAGGPPRLLSITGMGSSVAVLNKTGARLTNFANSLGIPFAFHTLPGGIEALTPASLRRKGGEALVVNSMMQLPRLLENDTATLRSVLQAVHLLAPEVVTVAERHFSPRRNLNGYHQFLETFSEALRHYSAIFDSLDATLPPTSLDRLSIEESWLGKEIVELICLQDTVSTENCEQNLHWKVFMERVGFKIASQSEFAMAQARLLLKLCYPADGYQLVADAAGCLLLGWQNTPLFSVSAWKQHPVQGL